MRHYLSQKLTQLARRLRPKSLPPSLRLGGPAGRNFLDAYRLRREPTASEMLNELKNTAWTCAGINASVCASFPPRLYIATRRGDPPASSPTRSVSPAAIDRIEKTGRLATHLKAADKIEEVIDHPLLDLLQQVNPVHNGFDLWELTQLYLEVVGCAYWFIDFNPASERPRTVWILPAQQVTPRRAPGSKKLVDYYEYRAGGNAQKLDPNAIIHFRFPDPRDPYLSGLSPLRACFEQAALTSEYAAMKRAIYDNTGLPSVVLSPDEIISEEERDRLEEQWNRKFLHGGAGKALVSESGLKVNVLTHSMGDLAALADIKATKEDIANAFHVPLPFLSGDTNLANMQAADHLHKTIAIRPRLQRRDEKLNERLLPLYDPTGRLFLMSDDPTPTLHDHQLKQQTADLKYGVRTINEIRSDRGLPPVPWGDAPQSPRAAARGSDAGPS